MEDITLTIDEIHAIREEHYEKTKNVSFDEYRKLLNTEIAPTLRLLSRMRGTK